MILLGPTDHNMRRSVLSAFLLLAILSVSARPAGNKRGLQLSVNLPGIEDTLQVRVLEKEGVWSAPYPVVTKKGKVRTWLPIDRPKDMVIMGMKFSDNRRSYRPLAIRIVALPHEKLSIGGTVVEPVIKGSPVYKEYGAVKKKVDQYKNTAEKDSVRMDYIRSHPHGEVAVMLSGELRMDSYFLVNQLFHADSIPERINTLYAQYKISFERQRQMKKAEKQRVVGSQAPDFTLMDINGKPLSLSSLRGKYVVLDFWGSWCGWCIKGFPDMKKYYEKYKGKFEILGIDCNDNEEKWKKSVADNQLPWLHVYNKKDDKDVTKIFGITGYPTKIIIDPEGKIARSIIGESPAFYTYLDELFQ